jgi:hypothetical protein
MLCAYHKSAVPSGIQNYNISGIGATEKSKNDLVFELANEPQKAIRRMKPFFFRTFFFNLELTAAYYCQHIQATD